MGTEPRFRKISSESWRQHLQCIRTMVKVTLERVAPETGLRPH